MARAYLGHFPLLCNRPLPDDHSGAGTKAGHLLGFRFHPSEPLSRSDFVSRSSIVSVLMNNTRVKSPKRRQRSLLPADAAIIVAPLRAAWSTSSCAAAAH